MIRPSLCAGETCAVGLVESFLDSADALDQLILGSGVRHGVPEESTTNTNRERKQRTQQQGDNVCQALRPGCDTPIVATATKAKEKNKQKPERQNRDLQVVGAAKAEDCMLFEL